MHGLSKRFFPVSDAGSSLLAVIGVMAVFSIISLVIVSSTMSSIGVTSSARATVQSQAAAEAGIDYARSSLSANGCTLAASTSSFKNFSVTVSYSKSDIGEVWGPASCPLTGVKRIKFTSEGWAESSGALDKASGDRRVVEAIYDFTPASVEVQGAGPAIYSYGNVSLKDTSSRWNRSTVKSTGAVSGLILVKKGTFACDSKVVISAEVRLGTGSKVGGCSVSKLQTAAAIPDWIDITYQEKEWTDRGFKIVALSSSRCTTAGVSAIVKDLAKTKSKGLIDARKCSYGLTLTSSLKLNTDVVIFAKNFHLGNAAISATAPANLWLITPADVEKTGTAGRTSFLMQLIKYIWELLFGGDRTKDTVNTGDDVTGMYPNCAGNESTISGSTVDASVNAILYTPCKVSMESTVDTSLFCLLLGWCSPDVNSKWNGQLYAGSVNIGPTVAFTYAPVGIAGTDFSVGTTTTTIDDTSKFNLGSRDSIRDVVKSG